MTLCPLEPALSPSVRKATSCGSRLRLSCLYCIDMCSKHPVESLPSALNGTSNCSIKFVKFNGFRLALVRWRLENPMLS